MQSAAGSESRLDAGTQPKVIRVAENDARVEFVASSSSKRMPLTVPAVPTGMKTGVSITRDAWSTHPARASPSVAKISKRSAGVVPGSKLVALERHLLSHRRTKELLQFRYFLLLSCASRLSAAEWRRNQTLRANDSADNVRRKNAIPVCRRK